LGGREGGGRRRQYIEREPEEKWVKVGGMGGEIENTLEIYIHTMHNIHGERVAIATHGGGGY
jgi:hypothetical protein